MLLILLIPLLLGNAFRYLITKWEFTIEVYIDKIYFKNASYKSTTIYFDTITSYEITHTTLKDKNTRRIGTLTNPTNKLLLHTKVGDTIKTFEIRSRAPKEIKNILDISTSNKSVETKLIDFDKLAFSYSPIKPSRRLNDRVFNRIFILLPTVIILTSSLFINANLQTNISLFPSIALEEYRKNFDIFQYAHLSHLGVEGQIKLSIGRSRDDDADKLSKIEEEYISSGKFYYNDIELFQTLPHNTEQIFDLYNGNRVTITFVPDESLQKKYNIKPISLNKTVELIFLGELINETTFINYQESIINYNSQIDNYVMNYSHNFLETKIRNGEIKPTAIYYRLDQTYNSITTSSDVMESSAMTLLFTYEYDGMIYLRGGTNIYGWGTEFLSYSDNYPFEHLQLSNTERNPEDIDEAMLLRGYSKMDLL